MSIELSLERFCEIYRMVTLGKLIHGLLHNLNGPLQNLGMDMEMMEHTVTAEKKMPEDLRDGILNRLLRMGEEFANINRLIKSASMRIDAESDYLQCGSLKGFLEQEISFLNANLHFKHNVQKDIQLADDLPRMDLFPENVVLALSWFIQALVEEVERGKAKIFTMRGRSLASAMEVSFRVEGGSCPIYTKGIDCETAATGTIRADDRIGIIVSLALLKLHGASYASGMAPSELALTLTIPYSRKHETCQV